MNDSMTKIQKYQTRSSIILYERQNWDLNFSENCKNSISFYRNMTNATQLQDVIINNSTMLNETPYITSEKYHYLNKNSSHKSVFRSTSTLFYDLDQIAKRHSYHCVNEHTNGKNKIIKGTNKENKHGFKAKSEAIVQECATNFHPKMKKHDSVEINTTKLKNHSVTSKNLSSEIFLKDSEYISPLGHNYIKDISNHHQKLWSYAKYRTEYTNPISHSKKYKKKDGKRTEDPCPCQLFSYACPCTNKKSLTELARNSKSLTGVNQITSTTKVSSYDCKNRKQNKLNAMVLKENQTESAHIIEFTDTFEIAASCERVAQIPEKQDIPKLKDNSLMTRNKIIGSSKPQKKAKQYICPNCKEKIEVISTTEEIESLNSKNSPCIRNKEIFSVEENTHSLLKTQAKDSVGYDDACIHSPPCELVPVCQILPIDQGIAKTKSSKQHEAAKPSPRSIRITKACRHHPPCTVAPSCQRINVLRNNCEYIPPCLHRPRCINLPLCVPVSKTLECDLIHKKVNETDNPECIHAPRCNFYPVCQYDSLNNNANTGLHAVQNTCEYLSEYTPRFIISPKMPCVSPTFSPCQVPHSMSCKCCQYNKSCQYDCADCKCSNVLKKVKARASSDAIIYIRDVGCQFRNRYGSPGDSLMHSKISSASFNHEDKKTGYYSKFHTLRYEDKFTNPISGEELSMSTVSTSSLDIDDHCPSHGKQVFQNNIKRLSTGFSPQSTNSPFVGAITAETDSPVKLERSEIINLDINNCSKPLLSKSRRSFLRKKHKCVLSVRRRRKARNSSHIFSTNRKPSCYPI